MGAIREPSEGASSTREFDSHDSDDYNKLAKIIIDEPAEVDALDFERYSQNLANIIRGTAPPQFAVGIFGKWGTGKTSLMRMIEKELIDKDSDKILTVWFDAWHYEKEKYLAVIPFLRQLSIAVENKIIENKGKPAVWDVLKNGIKKTFNAFVGSTDISISIPGSPISTSTDLDKAKELFKSTDYAYVNDERVYFHQHATDHLREALEKLEHNNHDSRIVVFIDDLDRCTPEKALEVLESVKAFFDIRGIVYVIGMDSGSIDHIIKQKYGEDSHVKGLDYLQKIVQLPFQIPVWKMRI